jgi:hypothetical protein
MMEGAPVFDYHVDELARITSRDGWMVLAVDDSFRPRLQTLAEQHNGGTLWELDPKEGSQTRFIVPPPTLSAQAQADARARFEQANAHDMFGVVEALRRQQDDMRRS